MPGLRSRQGTGRGASSDSGAITAPSALPGQDTYGNAAIQELVTEACDERSEAAVEGLITGHASPRWEHAHGRDPGELNLELSEDRAGEVESWFREIFARELPEDRRAEFALVGRSVDVAAPMGDDGLGVHAEGSRTTLEEAGGDRDADDPSMRRVDLSVAVTTYDTSCVGRTEPDSYIETIPGECESGATQRWSLKAYLSGGGGHGGVGAAFLQGDLKNRDTGQVATGFFTGGGLGVGAQTPGASIDAGWVDFETEDVCTHRDFQWTSARLTSIGAGLGAGYNAAWISFPMRGANSIYIGGFTGGNLGADAGTNVGTWEMLDVPGEVCAPDEEVERWFARDVEEPMDLTTTEVLTHSVYFDTGSHALSDLQLASLEDWTRFVVSEAVPEGVDPSRRQSSMPGHAA